MFDINLLARAGLQGNGVGPEVDQDADRVEAILSRMTVPASHEVTAEAQLATLPRRRRWPLFIAMIMVAAGALWITRPDLVGRWGAALANRLRPASAVSPPVGPVHSAGAVLARFLAGLPAGATPEFMAVGGGLLIYWINGEALGQPLGLLNAGVQGHRFSDLVAPDDGAAPDRWLGTVAFASVDQVGALRPVASEYERFFRRLKNRVTLTGGTVLQMVPGTLTAGEYVLNGSLSELHAHLMGVAEDDASVHYHRLSLLKDAEPAEQAYLLRVNFNLIEERNPSPRLSSLDDTGV